jgi:heme-degrading monooxygenase HmoA
VRTRPTCDAQVLEAQTPDAYTTAEWVPKAGHEDTFVDAWTGFAEWAKAMPGAGTLRLARDLDDPKRFVSFARWDSIQAVHQWKASPDFPAHMAQVQEHVERFAPGELEVVRAIDSPAAS